MVERVRDIDLGDALISKVYCVLTSIKAIVAVAEPKKSREVEWSSGGRRECWFLRPERFP
jgi:hypothetical protein